MRVTARSLVEVVLGVVARAFVEILLGVVARAFVMVHARTSRTCQANSCERSQGSRVGRCRWNTTVLSQSAITQRMALWS